MKTDAYQSLAAINAANQQIAEHIDNLKSEKLIPADFADAHKASIEEKISSINIAVIGAIEPREHQRSTKLARQWDRFIKRLRS
jgi:hypothetical protein